MQLTYSCSMSSTCPVLQFHPEFFLATSYLRPLPSWSWSLPGYTILQNLPQTWHRSSLTTDIVVVAGFQLKFAPVPPIVLSKFSFLFQFGPQLLDALNEGCSHKGAGVSISGKRGHHLTSMTFNCPHILGRLGTILKLHALPTHDELLPLKAHLG